MRLNHRIVILSFVLAAVMGVTGCVRMYSLPDAPPKSEWQTVEQQKKETPEDAMRRFLDAKRAAIQCFAALADGNWDKAMTWMSADSVSFFESMSNGQGAAAVFESRTLWTEDGEIAFDPVGDVFIRDLADIRDEFGNRQDNETETRKILYAVNSEGMAHEIVFVFEEDRWRLDMTNIQFDLLAP